MICSRPVCERNKLPSHSWCRSCLNEYTAERAKRRREYLNQAKSVPCMDCGVQYPPYVMDFDHIAGEKAFGLSQSLNRSFEKVLAEMEKCEVVCANCHRMRTFNEKEIS